MTAEEAKEAALGKPLIEVYAALTQALTDAKNENNILDIVGYADNLRELDRITSSFAEIILLETNNKQIAKGATNNG